jgi:hypothetical protein
MNSILDKLAADVGLDSPAAETLRLRFGYECALRIEHLLEEPGVIECVRLLGTYLAGEVQASVFQQAQRRASHLANQHRGSKSIDGCGHAAVSASYAVANAINGRAVQAASYAAYAKVYADGGYGAVAQREAFEPEFLWQVQTLTALTSSAGLGQQ